MCFGDSFVYREDILTLRKLNLIRTNIRKETSTSYYTDIRLRPSIGLGYKTLTERVDFNRKWG